MQGPQRIDLAQIDEGKAQLKQENEGTRRLLPGFEMANVKIHLLTDELPKIYGRGKYAQLFDIGVLSIHSASNADNAEINKIFKPNAKVHVETSDMLVILRKD